MSNYNFSQSLDGLNNIEADNISTSSINVNTATITTLNNINLVDCTSNTPSALQNIVNKNYVDSNFVDKINNQTGILGNKTFSNDVSVTGNLSSTISQCNNYRGSSSSAPVQIC